MSTEKHDNEDDKNVTIIYKKEKPLLKITLWFIGLVVTAIVLLFISGFIMGLLDIRPPTIDSQIAQNQWDKANGKETTEPPSELEKVTPTPETEKNN